MHIPAAFAPPIPSVRTTCVRQHGKGSAGVVAEQIIALAGANLASPIVLFFALGLVAALVRSDLSVPEAFAKGLTIYLMLAIGFKGGVAVARNGITPEFLVTAGAGILLGVLIPIIAHQVLTRTRMLDTVNAAAVAAHYGSVSIVTFVAGTSLLGLLGVAYDGYMIAVTAIMETPAIVVGLWLANRGLKGEEKAAFSKDLMHEVMLNGSVVLLMGAFLIGFVSGEPGMQAVAAFVDAPFKGILCLFMLDMGLLAGRRLASARLLTPSLVAFGVIMPLLSATLALVISLALGLSVGTGTLLMTLAASSSYIAVPAAMRIALPQANPAIYVTLSLAVTFPFNLSLGLPLYYFAASRFLS